MTRNTTKPPASGPSDTLRRRKLFERIHGLIVILLFTAGLEGTLRIVVSFAPGENSEKLKSIWLWHAYAQDSGMSQAAAYIRKRNTPNNPRLDHNSYGMKSPEIAMARSEGKKRILFLGDSTTYDVGPLSNTYPYLVCKRLGETGAEVEYLNAGVGGYTSTECLISYLLELYEFRPDIVVLYAGRNDLFLSGNRFYQERLTSLRQDAFRSTPSRPHQRICRALMLAAFTAELLAIDAFQLDFDPDAMGRPNSMDEYMSNIRKLKAKRVYQNNLTQLALATAQNGATLLIVGMDFAQEKCFSSAFPTDRRLTSEEKDFLDDCMRSMAQVGRDTASVLKRCEFLDLYKQIDRNDFLDDCHLNLRGNEQKAVLIADKLALLLRLGAAHELRESDSPSVEAK